MFIPPPWRRTLARPLIIAKKLWIPYSPKWRRVAMQWKRIPLGTTAKLLGMRKENLPEYRSIANEAVKYVVPRWKELT